jgi:hypothetical protein
MRHASFANADAAHFPGWAVVVDLGEAGWQAATAKASKSSQDAPNAAPARIFHPQFSVSGEYYRCSF